jgi:hypothetical protein
LLQSLWEWRPQIFLTGSSHTGKTLLVDEALSKGIFGALCMYVQKPTEAAIRQHMKYHSKILVVDEFEYDEHRQAILELFRTSSRGGSTIRGTADQRGASYKLAHMPWFVATETGLKKQPDKNRYIILDLNALPKETKGKTNFLGSTSRLQDLGARLLAVALRHHRETKRLAEVLKPINIERVPDRVVESLSLPIGMFAAIHRLSDEDAIDSLKMAVADWDFGGQSGSDTKTLLAEIVASNVWVAHGHKETVSYCLKHSSEVDCDGALCKVGIRRIQKDNGAEVLWIQPEMVSKELLRGGQFDGHQIEQHLLRLNGAKRSQQRIGGKERLTGIEVPIATIDELFASQSDDRENTVVAMDAQVTLADTFKCDRGLEAICAV